MATKRVAAVMLAAALVSAAPAAAQQAGYTASFYVARDTPSTADRSTSVYVFNSVDLTAGRIRGSLSVPFVRRDSTTTLTDPLTGVTGTTQSVLTGFGDPLVRVDVQVYDNRSQAVQIGISGSVKLPVVDADTGRGTGETDYAAGASLFKATGGTSVFADLLYWTYGDPVGLNYEDSWSYSVGAGRLLGASRMSAMASLSGFSRGLDGQPAPLQLNVALLAMAGRRQSLAFMTTVGLNDASGDFSIGTSWRIAR